MEFKKYQHVERFGTTETHGIYKIIDPTEKFMSHYVNITLHDNNVELIKECEIDSEDMFSICSYCATKK